MVRRRYLFRVKPNLRLGIVTDGKKIFDWRYENFKLYGEKSVVVQSEGGHTYEFYHYSKLIGLNLKGRRNLSWINPHNFVKFRFENGQRELMMEAFRYLSRYFPANR